MSRGVHEDAHDIARALVGSPALERWRRNREQVEMLFVRVKRILRLAAQLRGRAAHKVSLRSAPSRRTSAALQSWLLDRRQQQSRALRNRSNAHQRPVGERIIRVRLKRPQREPHD